MKRLHVRIKGERKVVMFEAASGWYVMAFRGTALERSQHYRKYDRALQGLFMEHTFGECYPYYD